MANLRVQTRLVGSFEDGNHYSWRIVDGRGQVREEGGEYWDETQARQEGERRVRQLKDTTGGWHD